MCVLLGACATGCPATPVRRRGLCPHQRCRSLSNPRCLNLECLRNTSCPAWLPCASLCTSGAAAALGAGGQRRGSSAQQHPAIQTSTSPVVPDESARPHAQAVRRRRQGRCCPRSASRSTRRLRPHACSCLRSFPRKLSAGGAATAAGPALPPSSQGSSASGSRRTSFDSAQGEEPSLPGA